MTKKQFHKIIYDYYREHRRDFPWRNTTNPYRIFISEVMLQQTQAPRVVSKYVEFIKRFPTFKRLATASTRDVLSAWQGLGYNRRALALQKAAQIVVNEYKGKLPTDPIELDKLPGIGQHTAGSIAAFAFNYPSIFIETNIRSVFIHHFFKDQEGISDAQLLPLITKMVDQNNPREWYWALMDYGVMLKKTLGNPSRQSKHYSKQSKFIGSRRQVRGVVIKLVLGQSKGLVEKEIYQQLEFEAEVIESVLDELIAEGFLKEIKGRIVA
ncbi:MAG: A/G-specific adenine glycosylase [Candidatus Buchananbacteria bacterium]|nr:A/G-specific adenine glycosylase [Candidatus Buchananbacteria bacterium]